MSIVYENRIDNINDKMCSTYLELQKLRLFSKQNGWLAREIIQGLP